MTIERFRHLAEAYGAEIDRWPAADRTAARALAEHSTEARRLLEQARVLDAWLELAAPDVDDAQADRVLDAIQERLDPPGPAEWSGAEWIRAGWKQSGWFAGAGGAPRSIWQTAGFLALMGLFGFVLGDLGVLAPPQHTVAPAGYTALVASTSSPIAWDQ